MMEVKGVGRKTLFLDDLRNRISYWELKIEKGGNNTLSCKHNKKIDVIFHKFIDLPTGSTLIMIIIIIIIIIVIISMTSIFNSQRSHEGKTTRLLYF